MPSVEELKKLLPFCRKEGIPFTILGNGSNVLISDDGLPGVTVRIGKEMEDIRLMPVEEEDGAVRRLFAGAGALLSSIAHAAAEQSLKGMEFASGIPGSFGGAILMNAGAYGGEMKDVLESVTVLTAEGEEKTYPAEELDLSYRHSRFSSYGEDGTPEEIIMGGVLRLERGEKEAIREKMRELNHRRVEKQPLEYPSAGSTFKRPEGYFAGKLIEDAGLRGYTVGGAQVSEKHCGFVVNRGGATAAEIYRLMKDVQRIVKENQGVELFPEVRLLGTFSV